MSIDVTVTHLTGFRQGQLETLRGLPIRIGRAGECALRFDPEHDVRVSAQHAELRAVEGAVEIHDLGSSNGVLVNGVRVEGCLEVPNHATLEIGEGGPRIRITFSDGGGISFDRVRRDTAVKLQKTEVTKRLVSTETHQVYSEPASTTKVSDRIARATENPAIFLAGFVTLLLLGLGLIAVLIFS